MLGRVQNQLNQPAEAETSLRKCLELGGDKEAALFVLNTALLRQRKTQEAAANRDELTKLKQAKGEQPDKFQDSYDFALRRIASVVFASAATLAETHDDFSEAERLYMRSLSLSPKNTEAYRGLLVVCQRQQRLADQKLLLSKLVELDSQDIISRTNLASVLLQMGDPGQAELTLKEAVQADPNGILAQAALAKLYLATGNSEGARIMAAEVVERQPTSATYRLLAAAYKASGMEEAFVAANKRADELGEAAKMLSPQINLQNLKASRSLLRQLRCAASLFVMCLLLHNHLPAQSKPAPSKIYFEDATEREGGIQFRHQDGSCGKRYLVELVGAG